MERKFFTWMLIVIILPVVIVAPIGITNAVVSNNRGKEILQNRVVWSLELSYELYNVNGTTLCGCNYTDSILVLHASFSEMDNHSTYRFYFEDSETAVYHYIIDMEIRLNRTSLLTDTAIHQHLFFNDWTKEYNIWMFEYFEYEYKVIAWWHRVTLVEDTQIANFSISNGFS